MQTWKEHVYFGSGKKASGVKCSEQMGEAEEVGRIGNGQRVQILRTIREPWE